MAQISVDIDTADILFQLSEVELKRCLKKLRPVDLCEIARAAGLVVFEAGEKPEMWRDLANEIRTAAKTQDWLHLEVLFVRMETLAGVCHDRANKVLA